VGEPAGDRERELVPALATSSFEERLEVLVDGYRVVSASDILEVAVVRRRNEPIPVALTFDDDLDSHLEVVVPLLLQRGLPATFFVGPPLPAGAAFWWEDLQALANGGEARREVQRSAILQHLNTVLPPSSGLIEALARLDPFPRIDGPEARVAPPRASIARADGVQAAAASVVKILGSACGLVMAPNTMLQNRGETSDSGMLVPNCWEYSPITSTAKPEMNATTRVPIVITATAIAPVRVTRPPEPKR